MSGFIQSGRFAVPGPITFPIAAVMGGYASDRTPSFTLGASPVTNDILVAFISATSSGTTTDVSGWTNVLGADVEVGPGDGSMTCVMLYHRVTSMEDSANTVRWDLTNLWDATRHGQVRAAVLRGVSTTDELVGTAFGSNATPVNPYVIPTVTPDADGCVIIAGVAGDGTYTQSTPYGWTLRAGSASGGSSAQSNYLYTRDTLGTAGSATGTTNVSSSNSDEYVSIVACFQPVTS